MTVALTLCTGRLPPRWSRDRVLAASLVLTAHLLMLWAIWQLRQMSQPQGRSTEAIPIRFVPERRARAVLQAGGQADRQRARAAAVLRPGNASPVESRADTPASTGGEAMAPAGATNDRGPSLAASAPGPLVLKSGRDVMLGSLSNPAMSDPRSNTPRPTFEERIAMGLDPGLCVKLDRLPNGEVRRRMGRMVDAQSAIQNTYGVGPHGIKVCE